MSVVVGVQGVQDDPALKVELYAPRAVPGLLKRGSILLQPNSHTDTTVIYISYNQLNRPLEGYKNMR